jgi:hypothetical protein
MQFAWTQYNLVQIALTFLLLDLPAASSLIDHNPHIFSRRRDGPPWACRK